MYAEAITAALHATSCVLSVRGSGPRFKDIEYPSRRIPTDVWDEGDPKPTFPEDKHVMYPQPPWRCRVCPKVVHDDEHSCCRLAFAQPEATGLYEAERGIRWKLEDACVLERFKNLQWPVPGTTNFGRCFDKWYLQIRGLGNFQRGNELNRRVHAAVFHVLRTAKILLRATSARLPPELLRYIVGCTYSSVLTPEQFDKVIKHAIDVEETRRVAVILCAAARSRTPRVPAEIFGENRRLVLRDEWLWNGGFVFARRHWVGKRILGATLPPGHHGTWPRIEDREAMRRYLWFSPTPFAAWPYDDDGRPKQVVPHTDPNVEPLWPVWPEQNAVTWVAQIVDGLAWWLSYEPYGYAPDSEGEEEPLWETYGNDLMRRVRATRASRAEQSSN